MPSLLFKTPLFLLFSLGILAYFGLNVGSTLYQSYQNTQRLKQVQQQVSQLQQQHSQLQQQANYQQSPQFIEEEARNKLSLARPNEVVVIFPEPQAVLGTSTQATTAPKSSSTVLAPNLTAWQKLFW